MASRPRSTGECSPRPDSTRPPPGSCGFVCSSRRTGAGWCPAATALRPADSPCADDLEQSRAESLPTLCEVALAADVLRLSVCGLDAHRRVPPVREVVGR